MPQDFSGQNLRGRSFRKQDLIGANFSSADICSADFSGANLTGANFSNAKAGLQRRWAILLVLVTLVLMGLSGFLSAFAGLSVVTLLFQPEKGSEIASHIAGFAVIVILLIFCFFTIRQGIQAGFGAVAVAAIFSFGLTLAYTLTGTLALALTYAFAVAYTVALVFAFAFAGVFAFVVGGAFAAVYAFYEVGAYAGALTFAVTLPLVLLSSYVNKRALKGDPKHALIRNMAVAFAAFKGTSFRNANLTDVNFTEAILKSTDFRKAILTRTCFYKTKKLDFARPGVTYLQKAQVLGVLVTGQGQDKNFDRLDLRGVNFKNAHLVDASFIGADLSGANLQDADLSRAKLQQTQLDGTEFTGATLTGVYIQDWNITSDTKFDGVRCEYVYMRVPTKENPDPLRKPDNREEVFADGVFGDFIQPIFDTLDLYHNQGVDPRAIAVAFKELAENNPNAELEIVAIERRGEDKILLRAKTTATASKSELSKEYFINYNQLKALAEKDFKVLIADKELQIRRLEIMVMTALERPSFYTETYTNQGDTIMPEGSKQQFNNNNQGAQFAGSFVNADSVNAHQIGGDITNYNQAARTEANNSPVTTILILAANPKNTLPLRLDEEVREIDTGLQRAKKRELFDLKQRWAVRVQDVYQALLDFKPQLVHFIGHGSGDDGLILEDETGNERLVNTVALAALFKLFASDIECVVLNACYSEVQASAIVKHIPYVIGMNKAIGDKAAIKFATGFYNALSSGESVEFAYKLGCNVIQLEGIPENLTPDLKKK